MAKRKSRAGKHKGEKPPPKCKAILLCDQIIVEAVTGNTTIVGVTEVFRVLSFPGDTKPCRLFLQLVDGIGKYQIAVELHDLHDNRVHARATGLEIDFPERLRKINLEIHVPALPLPHAGRYDWVVFANGQEIDRQTFVALSQEHQNGTDESQEPESG